MSRDSDYGRPYNKGLTRPRLVMWCEPELAIVILVFGCAIACPTGMAIRYDLVAIAWCVLALPLAQWLARIDPRLMRKWRAHRRWKPAGSALLDYVVDERTPLGRALDAIVTAYFQLLRRRGED